MVDARRGRADLRVAALDRRAAQARVDRGALGPRGGSRRRDRRLRHAGEARRVLDADGRRVRAPADRVDRLLGRRALSSDARDGQLRGHQGLDRRPDRRPTAPGIADRVRVRRVHRRRRGLWNSGCGRGRDAHRSRLLAVLRRGHLPAREHGARRFRLDRHSRGHTCGHHGHRRAPSERLGRPAVRAGLAVHSRLPDSRDGRLQRAQGRAAGGDRLRRLLRERAVPRVELRRAAARRHHGLDHGDLGLVVLLKVWQSEGSVRACRRAPARR